LYKQVEIVTIGDTCMYLCMYPYSPETKARLRFILINNKTENATLDDLNEQGN